MTEPQPAPRGRELMRAVMNTIIEKPGEWNQRSWHSAAECGTAHCVAG